MKKILTALLIVMAIFISSTLVACQGEPKYYEITFTQTTGVTFVMPTDKNGTEMQNGAKVREGYTVAFEVEIENGYVVEDELVVKAGDQILTANINHKYSFVMSKDTVITVSGVVEDTDGGDNGGDDNGGSNTPETTSHKLIYTEVEGVEFTDMTANGVSKVEEGTSVKFKVSLLTGYTGAYTVMVNGKAIYPDADDFYIFSMPNSVTTISVTGVSKMKQYNVTFSKGVDEMGVIGRVNYFCEQGDTEEGFTVYAGTEIKFTANVSSYYTDDYYIRKNTEIIEPDEDGVYTVYVTGHTDINAYGLEMETAFVNRDDGGKGTEQNPYKISKPIDLYYMAALINSDFYQGSGFNTAYYELTNDIDMEGEQLFVIGDTITSSAYFGGTFNGNGHTISNYYIADSIVDQESYVSLFLPYIGMFGFVQPGSNGAPAIYDLHLSDFTINIDATDAESTFVAGGICGIAIGATISACSVTNATISADADYGYFGYMGGIVGVHQSYYFSDSLLRYYATISSCYTDVEITGDSGYVYGAGGIAGYMLSHEDKTNAYILNCYTNGNVSGAINTGGIVGIADSHTAIMNCYATGDVEAYSAIELTGSAEIDSYAYACAGGIVGDIGYSSVVADSFFSGEVYSSAVAGDMQYAIKGEIAGRTALAEQTVIDAKKSYVVNAYGNANGVEFDETFYKTVLGWDEQDWVFVSNADYADHRFANEDGYPVVNYTAQTKTFTINFDNGDKKYLGNDIHSVQITDAYIPMSYWAIMTNDAFDGVVIPEFINADSGERSYGYFFDEELTQPVPYAFIPTGDITLYVGYADYSEVAGKYYLKTSQNGSGVYLELTEDGEFVVVDGARTYTSYYTYDGKDIFLFYTTLARYANVDITDQETLESILYYYYTFKANVDENGKIKIWDTTYFPANACLYGLLKQETFKYGTYFDGNGRYYTFNTDGTGILSGSATDTFTYILITENDEVSVEIKRNNVNATLIGSVNENGYINIIDNESVTAEDAFKGTWESKATKNEEITFDGKGNYEYVNYAYVLEGNQIKKHVISEYFGEYTLSEDGTTAIIGVDAFAKFNEDGNLEVVATWSNGIFYHDNSFVGTWYYSALKYEPVTVNLYGINSEGMGKGNLRYANNEETYEITYEARLLNGKVNLYLYEQDFDIAQLQFNLVENTLTGTFFSETKSAYNENAIFVLYDDYKGEWLSTCDAFKIVEFNGLGGYNVKGSATNVAQKGYAIIDGTTVTYVYDYKTQTAKMTYKEVEYLMANVDGRIVINNGEQDYELVRKDWFGGKTFVAEDGMSITFDGKGQASNGGNVVINKDGGSEKLTYTAYSGYASIDKNGISYYVEIDTEDGFWKLSCEEMDVNIKLYIKNGFTGQWKTSKGVEVVIGQFDASGIADGTYNGKEVKIVANDDLTVIEIDVDDDTVYFEIIDQKCIVISDGNGAFTDTLAIRKQDLDVMTGTYTNAKEESIIFNGFGTSAYGKGIALIGDKEYEYTINAKGEAVIKFNKNSYYATKACEEGTEGAYGNGTVYFTLLELDELYGCVAYDKNNVKFVFDGQGGVTDSDGLSYSYKLVNSDDENKILHFEFVRIIYVGTIKVEVKYDVEVDCSLSVYFITLTQRENKN